MPAFGSEDLGRAAEKFGSLIKGVEELPTRYEDLHILLSEMQRDLDPYSSHFARESPKAQDSSASKTGSSDSDVSFSSDQKVPLEALGARPVISDRIKWKHPPSFSPETFLDDLTRLSVLLTKTQKSSDSTRPVGPPRGLPACTCPRVNS